MSVKRVAVGLSGGVDSAVSAYMLKKEGFDVVGVYLEAWEYVGCEVDKNRQDALRIARDVGIPFKVLDVKEDYKKRVIDRFFNAYKSGVTPNPDVLCNSEIKFGLFLDWAIENGFDAVATGHYARIYSGDGGFWVQRGVDAKKDQSYFLWRVMGDRLSKVMFPLGSYVKDDVRAIAKDVGLFVADKPDSMGVCFIGDVDVREMLRDELGEKKGDVVMVVSGERVVVGKHKGLWFHTIGQRGGFDLDKKKLKKMGFDTEHMKPLFVIDKDVDENVLVVGERDGAFSSGFVLGSVVMGVSTDDVGGIVESGELFVRVRNLGSLHKVSGIQFKSDGLIEVSVDDGIFGVASGQSAVLYRRLDGIEGDEIVIGGGDVV